MTYTGPDWLATISAHKAEYEANERSHVDKALRMYRGDAWTQQERTEGSNLRLVSFNLLFAIVESAIAATVPNNLAFTVYEKPETTSTEWEEYLAQAEREGDWRGEACLSMVDAMITGRSILKTSPGTPCEVVRAVDPRRMYFDLAVRRPGDITYFIEFCPMSKEAFEKKTKGKKPAYKVPDNIDINTLATAYPEWLNSAASKTAGQTWIPIYEVVDIARRTVTHWIDGVRLPLCEWKGEDYYNPYSLYNLNLNGVDCRGLSEVSLVEDTVAAINRILVYWMEIIRKQVPITVYDSSRTDEDQVKKIVLATPGAIVGINSNGQAPLSAIQNMPPVEVPRDIKEAMAKLEQIVAIVSAMQDMSRGQVSGAKTATEVATIQSIAATRVSHRVARFYSAWEQAAKKALSLAHIRRPKLPNPWNVTMVAYSPMEKNREVLRERFLAAFKIMQENPEKFDADEVNKLFVEVFDLNPSVLLSPEQRTVAANTPPPADEVPPPVLSANPNPNALAMLQASGAEPEA